MQKTDRICCSKTDLFRSCKQSPIRTNSGRRKECSSFSSGVGIDCVREMLAHVGTLSYSSHNKSGSWMASDFICWTRRCNRRGHLFFTLTFFCFNLTDRAFFREFTGSGPGTEPLYLFLGDIMPPRNHDGLQPALSSPAPTRATRDSQSLQKFPIRPQSVVNRFYLFHALTLRQIVFRFLLRQRPPF